MSVEAHIIQLEQRHIVLETEISQLTHSPGTDSVQLGALKRRKLQLKDEISRLKLPAAI